MGTGIVVPLVLLPLLAVGVLIWYRRRLAELRVAGDPPTVSGVRLTAEALHRLPTPTWRVIHETTGRLGSVDHVVIGPPGVLAVTTVMGDRPPRSNLLDAAGGEPQLVAGAAIARGELDELARRADARCDVWARVFWGVPDPTRPPADELVPGALLVEGQRLDDWLAAAVAETSVLEPHDIVRVWRAINVGIGRPDPGG